jgi:hypothetical protein
VAVTGHKPRRVGRNGTVFALSSDVAALLSHDDFSFRISMFSTFELSNGRSADQRSDLYNSRTGGHMRRTILILIKVHQCLYKTLVRACPSFYFLIWYTKSTDQQARKLCIISDKTSISVSAQCAKFYPKYPRFICIFACTIRIIFCYATMCITGAHEVRAS